MHVKPCSALHTCLYSNIVTCRGDSGSLPILRDVTTLQFDLATLQLKSNTEYEITVAAAYKNIREGSPSSIRYTGGEVRDLSYKREYTNTSLVFPITSVCCVFS